LLSYLKNIFIVTSWLLACFVLPVEAQNESFSEEWRWIQFTTASGLPSNDVSSILETNDSTIWICTPKGVAYFDDYQWIPIDTSKGLPHGSVVEIEKAYDNFILVHIEHKIFIGNQNGFRVLPFDNVNSVVLFDDKTLLIHSASSLFLYRNETFEPFSFTTMQKDERIIKLYRTQGGKIWLNLRSGLYCWTNNHWEQKLPVHHISLSINSFVEDKFGNGLISIAIPVELRGLWEWKNNGAFVHNASEHGDYIRSVDIAPNGDILAYHESNVLRMRKEKTWFQLPPLPPHIQNIQFIRYRKNGDIWFGSNNGLFLFRQSSTRWTSQKYNIPDSRNRINEIFKTSTGDIWFGTGSGIEILHSSGNKISIEQILSTPLNEVTALGEDHENGIWIGSGSSFCGAFRFLNNRWKHYPIYCNNNEVYIHKIRKDRKGRLWFLGLSPSPFTSREDQPGAYVFENGTFTHWGMSDGLLHGRVYSFVEDRNGAYWFATYGGLSRWMNGQWKHWTANDGLKFERIFTVAVDSSHHLWFADQFSGVGMMKENGNIQYFTTNDGLVSMNVWEISVDNNGDIWCASSDGLACFKQNKWIAYDRKSGLHNSRLWALLPLHDKVLAGTLGAGFATLDLRERSQPFPRVVISPPDVEYNHALLQWHTFGYWGEPSSHNILTRYRIDEGQWSTWNTEREVTLNEPTSGIHTFQLQAKNLFGDFDTLGTFATFHIPLPWYSRLSFLIPMGFLVVVIGVLFTIMIRRKRKHEREIQKSNTRYRELFEESKDVIYISTPDGKLLDINQAGVDLFGYPSKEELLHANIEQDLYLNPSPRVFAQQTLREKGFIKNFELALKRKDGKKIYVLETSTAVRNEEGQCIAYRGILRDITEQKDLEERLRQSQKMESIGTLAGGIAHDFNNLLGIIEGYTSLTERALTLPEKALKNLDAIHQAVERGAKLVRQMLTFARKSDAKFESVNIEEILEDIQRFIKETFPKTLTCELCCDAHLPFLIADGNQIHQAILNLCLNARDAMNDNGTMLITTSLHSQNELQSRFPNAYHDSYVCIAVSDSGIGMDDSTKERIFEPFFTTKEKGKGTGLGLSVIYGIMKTHGGFIDVETALGAGTTIRLYFPLLHKLTMKQRDSKIIPLSLKGNETIFIIEDEIMLGEILRTMLEGYGYNVLWAKNGFEAVEMYRKHQNNIALIISDMGLPKLNGKEAYKQISAMNPNVKVIFASGFLEPTERNELFELGVKEFIPKPYDSNNVLKIVRETLDAK
jgi:PAS domain S-box-containing protein